MRYALKISDHLEIPLVDNKGDVRCPICKHKLQYRKNGLVCKNWKCKNYWKKGRGVCFTAKETVQFT